MKKLIVASAILIGLSAIGNAQSSPKQQMGKHKMELKNGVMVVDNKAMLCNNYKCTPLTETYTCTDGCKVSTGGTITKPDGTTMKLMNGYQIDKNGKVTMIPHGQKGHVCNESCQMSPSYKKTE